MQVWGENGSIHEKWIELEAVDAERLRKKNEERKGERDLKHLCQSQEANNKKDIQGKNHTPLVCVW